MTQTIGMADTVRSEQELKASINRTARAWLRSDRTDGKKPLHLVLIRAFRDARQTGVNLTDKRALPTREALTTMLKTLVNDSNFSTHNKAQAALTKVTETLRIDVFDETDPSFPPIETIVCKKPMPAKPDGSCCSVDEEKRGCDAGAGTVYLAKTNGRYIVYSNVLTERRSRAVSNRFVGIQMSTLTLFAVLHEFGHVLYLNNTTRTLFKRMAQFYAYAAPLLDADLRDKFEFDGAPRGADFNEFVASMYAVESVNQ